MVKEQLKYVGAHLPQEIVEVQSELVDGLIKTGNYKPVKLVVEEVKKLVGT